LLAAAALDKQIAPESYEESYLVSTRVRDMMKKVDLVRLPLTEHVQPSADLPAAGRVVVRARGSAHEERVAEVAGGPEQPMAQDARYMKVAACMKGVVADVGMGRLVPLCEQLDAVADVREVTEHLRRA
ncbi:MAG: hypothetical protein K8I02_05420, partial [Candidatus Methylomirabilis sp.]|nr:hypothetical protein [Deltaproteobacteria bacterium]